MSGINEGRTPVSQAPIIDLGKPRYHQSTYIGRATHFFEVTDPRNVLLSTKQLYKAKELLALYKWEKANCLCDWVLIQFHVIGKVGLQPTPLLMTYGELNVNTALHSIQTLENWCSFLVECHSKYQATWSSLDSWWRFIGKKVLIC